jgi:N-dimethylarginine dimethylaminohydrolase
LSFEGAGDALFAGDKLFAAYGFRTEARVYNDILKKFSDGNNNSDIQLILCELIDPHFYHIDTCFCPLDDKTAIWNPFAFREEARKRMENEIELLAVPKKEADYFACNSVVIGKNIITPSRCEETGKMLEKRGFEVHSVEMTEFLKAGGACKCLTLAL